MKSLRLFLLPIVILTVFSCRQSSSSDALVTSSATDANGYEYEFVSNDASNTRIYTLENGLKVYLSRYTESPRIMTYLPVKAGGKFDPANSTGLAHYLEHMMFKGTDRFGTKDWAREKPLLDEIEKMFEEYREITDPEQRKAHYAKIDELSVEAAKYAIANEYDKMCTSLGYQYTNAYTTEDRTVYMNDIPANQLENFLKVESDRFKMIVNRLFHTELEAVYEEKNRSLDNDYWKTQEALMGTMFDQHPYGTQTVIGTIEHLKNPSITDINAYFDKYYVPNNMAICLSGDLAYDKTIKLIDQYFGVLPSKPLDEYAAIQEPALTANREKDVWGPDSEQVTLGFRMGGTSHEDFHKLHLVDYMLANSSAGLIDLDLVQQQKVLEASCYVNEMNDYSIHTLYGKPRQGQPLEEVRDLLLEQVEKIKRGDFEDWLIEAVINNWKVSQMSQMESNFSRSNAMVMAFTNNMSWQDYISIIDRMETVTKEEIVQFAQDNYQHYVCIYKRSGEDPNKLSVEKPEITGVELDRTSKSPFLSDIVEAEVEDIEPVFIDYEKDLAKGQLSNGIPFLYKQNEANEIFTLYYLLETGTNENPSIGLALDYLEYLGTDELEPAAFKQELYKLGCNFGVSSSNERIYVYLSGLSDNMKEGMLLFEDLLENPKGNQEVLLNMISDKHKSRSDSKKNKSTILWQGLASYAQYGSESPFTNVLSNEELNNLDQSELIDMIKSLQKMEHKIMYYGPMTQTEAGKVIEDLHRVPAALQPVPARKTFAKVDRPQSEVFFTHYDMVQAETMLSVKQPEFDKSILPEVNLFNEYFGSGMASVLFQEIREARGLAYSVFAQYSPASKAGENDQMMAYVGTQADKQEEALDALIDLLNNLPESQESFENSRNAILRKIESNRITKTSVFFNYLAAEGKNLDYDVRKDVYQGVSKMSFDGLKSFHTKYIANKKPTMGIIADKDKIDLRMLSKYGEVTELSLEELFGYDEYSGNVKG